MRYIFITLLLISNASYADQIYYHSEAPTFANDKVLKCDANVRENADKFKDDINNIYNSYTKRDWDEAKKGLSAFGVNKQKNNILKNTYIKSILYCSGSYKFSNEIDYYRELLTTATLFFINMDRAVTYKSPDDDNIKEGHEFTIHYLDVILNGINKTANK